jgi:hypothetical protein
VDGGEGAIQRGQDPRGEAIIPVEHRRQELVQRLPEAHGNAADQQHVARLPAPGQAHGGGLRGRREPPEGAVLELDDLWVLTVPEPLGLQHAARDGRTRRRVEAEAHRQLHGRKPIIARYRRVRP